MRSITNAAFPSKRGDLRGDVPTDELAVGTSVS